MTVQPGWFERQCRAVKAEVASWPQSLREAAGLSSSPSEEPMPEIERLTKVAGLMANPAIAAAVNAHIEERYKSIKSDSCGSCVHKLYQSGDALNGPSTVVEWDHTAFWFSPDGDGVIVWKNHELLRTPMAITDQCLHCGAVFAHSASDARYLCRACDGTEARQAAEDLRWAALTPDEKCNELRNRIVELERFRDFDGRIG